MQVLVVEIKGQKLTIAGFGEHVSDTQVKSLRDGRVKKLTKHQKLITTTKLREVLQCIHLNDLTRLKSLGDLTFGGMKE